MKIKSFKPKQQKWQNQPKVQNNIPVTSSSRNKVRLVPLGGMGDVTKNMYVYEYQDSIVIIDCGVGFPEEGMLGIDLVIPDISYLKDKKSKIKGIVITHGHDDHIGGLPYIWPELNCPIYAQRLTAGLIRSKFNEHKLPKDRIKEVKVSDKLQLGSFAVSFYHITHSIPDTVGIVMETPVGTLVHQADFKIDWTPVIGTAPEIGKMAAVGNKGVAFMTMDCLRVEKSGYTLSERTIEGTFEAVEKKTPGKVLITMTSSNVSRIQQAVNVAFKSGRKLALSGRSLESNFQVARDLGYLDVPPGLVIPQDEIKSFAENKIMILIAGSQGQPGSALSRAAHNDHKFVYLKKGDCVVFSADPIPSTQLAQESLIDTLTKSGVEVYYSALTSDLHVSGHAAQEELKMMLNLLKPNSVLPIGGTFRHMKVYSNMAQNLGYRENQIIDAENGDIIEIDRNGAKINGYVDTSNVYIDGLGVGDVGNVVLRDRQTMAEEGVVVVVISLHKQTGALASEPDIISRGFVYEKHAEDLIESAREIVQGLFREPKRQGSFDWRYIRSQIEENLEKFFYQATNRRPMILPIIVDL